MQVLADHTGDLQLWLRYIAQQHSQRAANVADIRLAYHQGLQVRQLALFVSFSTSTCLVHSVSERAAISGHALPDCMFEAKEQ